MSQFALGQEVPLLVQQAASRKLQIDELTVSLICDTETKEVRGGKTRYNTAEYSSKTISLLKKRAVQPHELLSAAWTLTVPVDQQPSTPPSSKDYPQFHWQLEVHTHIHQSPDYRAKFPILIHRTA